MLGLELLKDIVVGLFTNQVQKWIDGKKPQVVVNIPADKLIILDGDKEFVESRFRPLFDWLKDGNADSYILEVGETLSQQFVNFWNKIKDDKNISPGQMIEFFENIKSGSLNWMIREFVDGKKVAEYLNDVQMIAMQSIDNQFFEIAKATALLSDKDLKQIEDENLGYRNIGGMIAVLKTNSQFTNREVLHPEFIGFKKVKRKDALVNLAKQGKLSIQKVSLQDSTDWDYYDVILTLKNNTENHINFTIPKGQIFENKDINLKNQNLTAKEEESLFLDAFQENDFTIKSFCLNEKLLEPTEEGNDGNVTIFEVSEKNFKTQRELWDNISKNKDKLQFAKW